jgi:hypothetical protein
MNGPSAVEPTARTSTQQGYLDGSRSPFAGRFRVGWREAPAPIHVAREVSVSTTSTCTLAPASRGLAAPATAADVGAPAAVAAHAVAGRTR